MISGFNLFNYSKSSTATLTIFFMAGIAGCSKHVITETESGTISAPQETGGLNSDPNTPGSPEATDRNRRPLFGPQGPIAVGHGLQPVLRSLLIAPEGSILPSSCDLLADIREENPADAFKKAEAKKGSPSQPGTSSPSTSENTLVQLQALALDFKSPDPSRAECVKELSRLVYSKFKTLEVLSKSMGSSQAKAVSVLENTLMALAFYDLGQAHDQNRSILPADLSKRALTAAELFVDHLTHKLSVVMSVSITDLFAIVNPKETLPTMIRIRSSNDFNADFALLISHLVRAKSAAGSSTVLNTKDLLEHAVESLELLTQARPGAYLGAASDPNPECVLEYEFDKSEKTISALTSCTETFKNYLAGILKMAAAAIKL